MTELHPRPGIDTTTAPYIAPAAPIPPANRDFADLKKQIIEARLLEKQPAFYVYKIAFTYALALASVAFMLLVHNPWLQMLNALFAGFASSQVLFLGHDAGHRQIAKTSRGNDLIGLFVGNISNGVCFTWWMQGHNAHHAHTNDIHNDPDLDYPVLAFDEEQIAKKKGWQKWIVARQKFFFFPILSLAGFNLKCGGIKYIVENKWKGRAFETTLIAMHFAAYFGFLAWALSWWAIPFFVLHHMSLGVFLGSVFAPNHKGMPLVEGEARKDYLRVQVLTSRNVYAHPVTDFMYGALNYQIEHHLFPSIPRNKMRQLQRIVKNFCDERDVKYYETSTIGSYREIMDYLHEVSAPLREKR